MKTNRLTLPIALVVAGALVLGACGGSSNAATVNGTSISKSEFDKETRAIAANQLYAEVAQSAGVTVAKGKNTTNDMTATWLTQLVNFTLVSQEFGKRKLTVSAEDTDDATRSLPGYFKSQAAWDAFPDWFKKLMVERQAKVVGLAWALIGGRNKSAAEYQQYFDQNLAPQLEAENKKDGKYCVDHILLTVDQNAPDKGEAQLAQAKDLVNQLRNGGDFAALANQFSGDPGSKEKGGSLGCSDPSGYVTEFKDAVKSQQLGAIGDPVKTQFGYHIIRVRNPALADFATGDLTNKLVQISYMNAVMANWYARAVAKAKVSVDPQYGKAVTTKAAQGSPPQLYVSPKEDKSASTTTAPIDPSGLNPGNLPTGAGGGNQVVPGANESVPTPSAPAPSTPG